MNEEIIIKEGVHYIGDPCKRCGSHVRYVSTGKCVLCEKERQKQRYKKIKEMYPDNDTFFEGCPCKNCGSCVKYISGGCCVLCKKRTVKKSHQNRKEKHNDTCFESSPCINCGGIIRYVSTGNCVGCMKEHGKHHQIRKQKNQITKQKSNTFFYEGNPCKKCGSCIRYASNQACVLCQREAGKQYRKDNPNTRKQWEKSNPEKMRINSLRRRARKQNAEGDFTTQEWIDLCNQYHNICLCCKEEKPLEADHIVPLSKGGTNNIDNIQPLCKSCNSSKHTKTIDYRPDPTLINPAPATN
jgi:hypothetical protein